MEKHQRKNDWSSRQKDKSHLVAQQMYCIVDTAIKNVNQLYESIGSGFIFDGHVFTCSHVVDGHKKFHITTCDSRKIKGKEYYFTKEQKYSVTIIIITTYLDKLKKNRQNIFLKTLNQLIEYFRIRH